MNKKSKRYLSKAIMAVGLIAMLGTSSAWAVRVKDVTHIEGIRDNQLQGLGLVVGLNGTGDGSSTEFTIRMLVSYLRRNGVTIDPDLVKVDNVAAVIVVAELPAFARPGSRIDVQVNSIGDADNLQGGTLLMTPLSGADQMVYAVAQGAIAVGGFSAGGGGASASKNHTTAGKIPGGALVEQAPPTQLEGRSTLNLILSNPDFTTAQRIAEAINKSFDRPCAQAVDAAGVRVAVPAVHRLRLADFIAEMERLPVHPDQRARVVIDERNGTVVMGEDVRISTLAIAHGNLTIQLAENKQVSQPEPYSFNGETVPFSNTDVAVQEEDDELIIIQEGVSLGELVHSLNAIGVTPRDLISILQSIKTAGYLQCELVLK